MPGALRFALQGTEIDGVGYLGRVKSNRFVGIYAALPSWARRERNRVPLSLKRSLLLAHEPIFLVLEEHVECGQGTVNLGDVLLQIKLVRVYQFFMRIDFCFKHAKSIPCHDDFMEKRIHRYFFRLQSLF